MAASIAEDRVGSDGLNLGLNLLKSPAVPTRNSG